MPITTIAVAIAAVHAGLVGGVDDGEVAQFIGFALVARREDGGGCAFADFEGDAGERGNVAEHVGV